MSFMEDDPSDTSVQAVPFVIRDSVRVYNGREYYSVTPEMSAAVVQIDKRRLHEVAYAGEPSDDRLSDLFWQPVRVEIFINENGDVAGVGQASSSLNPALKEELMNLRVQSPASFSGKAVPSWFLLMIDVPNYIK